MERLGAYQATWGVGLHFKIPIIEKVARRVDLKEQVVDFAPQPVITKDNVTMQIDTVVYFQITDPKLYTYGVENPINAIENLTATTLRNIIGDLELDATLTSRDVVNKACRLLNTKKIGHCGSLDPFATGILILGVNKGTKILQFLENGRKKYIAKLKLGVLTETLDITGKEVENVPFETYEKSKN